MRASIAHDRPAQLLLGADSGLGYDEARLRLERSALVLMAADTARRPWGQAALLTIAQCAVRMFRGGVYLGREFCEPVVVGNRVPVPLQFLLIEAGCRRQTAPAHAVTLYVGADTLAIERGLRCWADGWVATVSSRRPAQPPVEGNEISGALTGALAVAELFRAAVLNDIRAGKRTQRLSALRPGDPRPSGLVLERLPSQCWLLGLGNLGQATLWMLGKARSKRLGLLPYLGERFTLVLGNTYPSSGGEIGGGIQRTRRNGATTVS